MNLSYINLRTAWRPMTAAPGTTMAILVLLALGIGGVMAVFNPIYSMFFTPLSLPQPEQLVRIGGDIRLFNIYYAIIGGVGMGLSRLRLN